MVAVALPGLLFRLQSGCCFNPRPGHATGATKPVGKLANRGQVSIRAPVTRPGRLAGTLTAPVVTELQSAPRSRDRGDPKAGSGQALVGRFNPRPGHATGATSAAFRSAGCALL